MSNVITRIREYFLAAIAKRHGKREPSHQAIFGKDNKYFAIPNTTLESFGLQTPLTACVGEVLKSTRLNNKEQCDTIVEYFVDLIGQYVGKATTHVVLYKYVADGIYLGYLPTDQNMSQDKDAFDNAMKAVQDKDTVQIIHVAKQ